MKRAQAKDLEPGQTFRKYNQDTGEYETFTVLSNRRVGPHNRILTENGIEHAIELPRLHWVEVV